MNTKNINYKNSFWKIYMVLALVALALPVKSASAAPLTIATTDGQGTMTVSPSTVVYGTGKTFTFTFTAVGDIGGPLITGGYAINLTIPTGWTAPTGHITITNVDCGATPSDAGITGQTIPIDVTNCAIGKSFTL